MGAMKELGATLAVEYHTNPALLRERLMAQTFRDQAWYVSQLGAVKNYWDGDGAFLPESNQQAKLATKVFIGGEGVPKTFYRICTQCLRDFGPLLRVQHADENRGLIMKSDLLPELTLTIQDEEDSRPTDELERCSCGNWMWDRAGHDVVLEAVERGQMSAEVATAWLNRNFSYELDTRAYNEDFINSAIVDWETRWLD